MPFNPILEPHQHSEEVQDIITEVPSWLVRWGITLFLAILLGLVGIAAAIKTPDTIKGQLKISSRNRPEEIIPRTQGKLVKLFVQEDSQVDSGAVLGFIESNAQHHQVLTLSATVDRIHRLALQGQDEKVNQVALPASGHLGELQLGFQEFYQAHGQFVRFLKSGLYARQAVMLQHDLAGLKQINRRLLGQLALQEKDLEIARNEFAVQQNLAEQKVISPMELKREESKLIGKMLPLENIRTSLISNQAAQSQKEQEAMALGNSVREEKMNFISRVNQLKSEIDAWKRTYVLQTRTAGKVVFQNSLMEGQWLEANKPLFYIASAETGGYWGEFQVGQSGMGKVKVGQKVIVRLDAYPYQEYGLLNGRIEYLSDFTGRDTSYLAKVSFPQALVTTHRKELLLKDGLMANAEIVAKERSLISRLFYSLAPFLEKY